MIVLRAATIPPDLQRKLHEAQDREELALAAVGPHAGVEPQARDREEHQRQARKDRDRDADRAEFLTRVQVVEEASPNVLFNNPTEDRTKLFLSQILHH